MRAVPEQVPAGVAHQPVDLDRVRAGLAQRLATPSRCGSRAGAASCRRPCSGPRARRCPTSRSASRTARRGCVSSGRSSPKRPQLAPCPRCARTWRWWSGPQTCVAGTARERGVDRPERRRQAPLGAADEAALLVGLVELEATRSSSRTGPASSRGSRRTARRRWRTDASSAACPTRPELFASPSGCAESRRQQQQPRRPDGVRREHDHLSPAWKCSRPSRSIHVAPVTRPAGVRLEPPDAGAGDQPSAGGDRLRPVGEVGRGLRALGAALLARARAGRTGAGRRTAPRGSS